MRARNKILLTLALASLMMFVTLTDVLAFNVQNNGIRIGGFLSTSNQDTTCFGVEQNGICIMATLDIPPDIPTDCIGVEQNGICILATLDIPPDTPTTCDGVEQNGICIKATLDIPPGIPTTCDGVEANGICIKADLSEDTSCSPVCEVDVGGECRDDCGMIFYTCDHDSGMCVQTCDYLHGDSAATPGCAQAWSPASSCPGDFTVYNIEKTSGLESFCCKEGTPSSCATCNGPNAFGIGDPYTYSGYSRSNLCPECCSIDGQSGWGSGTCYTTGDCTGDAACLSCGQSSDPPNECVRYGSEPQGIEREGCEDDRRCIDGVCTPYPSGCDRYDPEEDEWVCDNLCQDCEYDSKWDETKECVPLDDGDRCEDLPGFGEHKVCCGGECIRACTKTSCNEVCGPSGECDGNLIRLHQYRCSSDECTCEQQEDWRDCWSICESLSGNPHPEFGPLVSAVCNNIDYVYCYGWHAWCRCTYESGQEDVDPEVTTTTTVTVTSTSTTSTVSSSTVSSSTVSSTSSSTSSTSSSSSSTGECCVGSCNCAEYCTSPLFVETNPVCDDSCSAFGCGGPIMNLAEIWCCDASTSSTSSSTSSTSSSSSSTNDCCPAWCTPAVDCYCT